MEIIHENQTSVAETGPKKSLLENGNDWLRLALEAANMGAYKWDLETGIVTRANHSSMDGVVNPYSDSWSYEEGLRHIHPEDQEMALQKIKDALTKSNILDFEYRAIDQDSKIRWFHTRGRALCEKNGKASHILFVAQDITAKKESEFLLLKQRQEITLTKNQLMLTLELAGMVALPNRRHNVKYKSPEMCRFFGISDENTEFDRNFLFTLVHPDDRERLSEDLNGIFNQPEGQPLEIEFRTFEPSGKTRWIMIKGAHVPDEQGGARYFVFQDITNRKQIEEKIRQNNEELSSVNRKLDRFSSVVAHDLKNPLTAISLNASLLKRDGSENEIETKADKIVALVRRMTVLIDEILTHAQSGDDSHFTKESVLLSSVLETVQDNLSAAISSSQAQIKVGGNLPVVRGSPLQLVRLFQNLISNALKFKSAHRPEILISALDQGSYFRISVKDNGVGFDSSQSQKLFEPFERVPSKVEGFGLGLSICKRIVEMHGGKIGVESAFGIGSEFYFTLPK